MSKYRTSPLATKKMPPGIPYIIGNEAAERFSFYGMKTILAVFMVNYLHLMGNSGGNAMSEAAANEKVHLFVSAVYLTPFLGALLCDAFLGKYRTIIYLSLVYCAGHAALALMGIAGDASTWLLGGLILISLGSGGIKPCVSAHVGDQFGKTNSNLLTQAFNFFYFSINFGAFLSTMLTPWLLKWYGPHWAFGIPGALMALATLLFWMGRKKFIHIPARGSVFFRELFSREGLVAFGKLAIIFFFVAFFWTLFDQTATSWVFQAKDMDRNWLGFEWLPSQIQAINPIFILIFIPLFTFIVYPAINRVFKLTPMRKIAIGLFVMVGGFVIIALAQERIDAGGRPSIAWQVLAYVVLTAAEVMVSIVALEFSYTQAPKAMKSVILALFLGSVSLGNLITAGVNHFIQVPSVVSLVKAPEGGGDVIHPGLDSEAGTLDDITFRFDKNGKFTVTNFAALTVIKEANEIITEYSKGGTLPNSQQGQQLIGELRDPWGNTLRYKLRSSTQFRVSSDGADLKEKTIWDTGTTVNLKVEEKDRGLFDIFVGAVGMSMPEKSWLENREEKLNINSKSNKGGAEPDRFDITFFAGGQSKLEGASYFWFFVWLMLGAAGCFVLVVKFYKPRTYLQEESPDDDPDNKETSAA
ncbi:MAG: POT family MFS transporter [Verrucomicrobiales bacterium]|nr:POT family MFS transporter [Verrucomicrobiales bacterium]MED5587047.1 POT family MFS transporter [Verrucomicrobiota bacterium]